MPISVVTPHPVSSGAIARWLIVGAILALVGLIIAVGVLSTSSPTSGPRPAAAGPAPVRGGYFRDPVTHALLPVVAQPVPLQATGGAVSRPRP